MTTYSSEEEEKKASSIEEQAKKAEALARLVDAVDQNNPWSEEINSLYKENGEVNPETILYIWAKMLSEDNELYSEENKKLINEHFDKIFTKEQKQHILIIWKYSDKRRELTYPETISLFEKVLKEEKNRLTKEEEKYILEYIEEDEEMVISEEKNLIETDKIFSKFSSEWTENNKDSKMVLFKELLSEERNRLSHEEEQEIISFFVLNNISLKDI